MPEGNDTITNVYRHEKLTTITTAATIVVPAEWTDVLSDEECTTMYRQVIAEYQRRLYNSLGTMMRYEKRRRRNGEETMGLESDS